MRADGWVREGELRRECEKDAYFAAGKLGMLKWAQNRIKAGYPVSLVKYALDHINVQIRRGRKVHARESLADAILEYQVRWTWGELTQLHRRNKGRSNGAG